MVVQSQYTNIYNKSGTLAFYIPDYDYASSRPTIWDLLNTSVCISNWVTELSATLGGAALAHNLDAYNVFTDMDWENKIFYDATPDIPDIALRIHNTRIRR